MTTIADIAAEYSRFTRELADTDNAWTKCLTDLLNQPSGDTFVDGAMTHYVSYRDKFVAARTDYYGIMQKLTDLVADLKKDGGVPFSVSRTKTKLLKFNSQHRIEKHLDERVESIDRLLAITREA